MSTTANTLTLIRFWGNIQHEREEVLQKLGVVVRKMQTFAVFSEEQRTDLIPADRQRVKSREQTEIVVTLEPETRVLQIQRSWAAMTACL